MSDNQKSADLTTMVYGMLSLKTKIIILGIILGFFLILLIPVIALASLTSSADDEEETTTTSSEVSSEVTSDSTYQYTNATIPMPFESWDSSQDVVTSLFSKSRTVIVNRSYNNKSTYRH